MHPAASYIMYKKFKNPIDKTKVRYYINERKVLALKAIEC
jgi:hypothetical protein